MIAIPEALSPAETNAAMIADEAAIGAINQKTTAKVDYSKRQGRRYDRIWRGSGNSSGYEGQPSFVSCLYCAWWTDSAPFTVLKLIRKKSVCADRPFD